MPGYVTRLTLFLGCVRVMPILLIPLGSCCETEQPLGLPVLAHKPQRSPNAQIGWSTASTRGHNSMRRPPEREKKSKLEEGREKKARNFGPPPHPAPILGLPPFGPPPIGLPLFLGLGPHPLGAPPSTRWPKSRIGPIGTRLAF